MRWGFGGLALDGTQKERTVHVWILSHSYIPPKYSTLTISHPNLWMLIEIKIIQTFSLLFFHALKKLLTFLFFFKESKSLDIVCDEHFSKYNQYNMPYTTAQLNASFWLVKSCWFIFYDSIYLYSPAARIIWMCLFESVTVSLIINYKFT